MSAADRWAVRGSVAVLVAAVALGWTLPLGTFIIGFITGIVVVVELFSARILHVKQGVKT